MAEDCSTYRAGCRLDETQTWLLHWSSSIGPNDLHWRQRQEDAGCAQSLPKVGHVSTLHEPKPQLCLSASCRDLRLSAKVSQCCSCSPQVGGEGQARPAEAAYALSAWALQSGRGIEWLPCSLILAAMRPLPSPSPWAFPVSKFRRSFRDWSFLGVICVVFVEACGASRALSVV